MWIEPKVDWSASDYIRSADYNRMVGNLNYLKELAAKVYKPIDLEEMHTINGTQRPYPSQYNAVENNLDIINNNTIQLDIGEKKQYISNGHTIDYNELNRLENSMLLLYNTLYWTVEALPRLPLSFSTQKGIRP